MIRWIRSYIDQIVLACFALWLAGFVYQVGRSTEHQEYRKKVEAANKAEYGVQHQAHSGDVSPAPNHPPEPKAGDGGHEAPEVTFLSLKLGEALLAFVTVWLVLVTKALVDQTRELVTGAEATARRQLRAYLVVEADTLENFEAGKITCGRFNIRDVGQTPAHEVVMATGVVIVPRGYIPTFPAPPSTILRAEKNARSAYFGGDQIIHTKKDALRPFDQNEIDDVLADRSRVCVGGRVYYKDIFGYEWHTDFVFAYSGPETRTMIPEQYQTGNNAT
ncbi:MULTISPECIES: hypothetical protein [unclassified Bradyrhizobium]|uniref:hypothetical protein n=1 Tax=Bradyrhizobium sp. USDA 4541 TaxID=2817704 RepID=UPI0020A450D0|nr:hypothetical protein [Bradyrhizobium sp. USDA 4541]MCP1851552.1 hypothetical protein [Bradyrhizobium sp. USDA 4541]